MKAEFAGLLRSRSGEDLRLDVFAESQGDVSEGVLWDEDDRWYPIIDGVPCFLEGEMRPDFSEFRHRHGLPETRETDFQDARAKEQLATNTTFSDKWRRFKKYGHEPQHQDFLFDWYCKKLGLPDIDALREFYRGKERILEVGPGSGFNSKFMSEATDGTVCALDISEAAFTVHENTAQIPNCHVVQADLMEAPFPDGSFDFIIADGVLHHTPDTRAAVFALYEKLAPGGQFYFYVYREMGAARVFCDEYLRKRFTPLEAEDCYAACEGLTELGRELSNLGAKVTLEKGIPELGIPPGTHDVQRLFYYNFLKCFWNDAFDFETNNMVNFDWYHPHNAWQHSQSEVAGWLEQLGVNDYSFNDSNPNGISVLLRKPLS